MHCISRPSETPLNMASFPSASPSRQLPALGTALSLVHEFCRGRSDGTSGVGQRPYTFTELAGRFGTAELKLSNNLCALALERSRHLLQGRARRQLVGAEDDDLFTA